jgi:hypothetical protein
MNLSHYRAKYALMQTNETALGAHCHFGSKARGSMSISQIAASQTTTSTTTTAPMITLPHMMKARKCVGPIGIAQSPFPHKRIASIQKSARRSRLDRLVRSAKETLAPRTAGIVVVLPAALD